MEAHSEPCYHDEANSFMIPVMCEKRCMGSANHNKVAKLLQHYLWHAVILLARPTPEKQGFRAKKMREKAGSHLGFDSFNKATNSFHGFL